MQAYINNLFTYLPVSSHLYYIDMFHDVPPPCDSLQCLVDVSAAVYKALVSADAAAVWVLPGDMFYKNASYWGLSQACCLLMLRVNLLSL
jgi:Alpha-N-acetylglucosaminidase (NAGLU) tim-barrel domain